MAPHFFTNTVWNNTQTLTNLFTSDGSTAISNWADAFGSAVTVVDSGFNATTRSAGTFTLLGATLSWSAVPEPTSALAGILLGAGLIRGNRGMTRANPEI